VGALCVVAACVVACRAGGRTGSVAPLASSDVITRAEIEKIEATTALDVIQRLRPSFLRYRGTSTASNPRGVAPVVYFGEDRLGGLNQLSTVNVVHIEEIRFISAIDATTRWGAGHTGGVILIVVRTQ
jgi:outer membrane cobalamin receptor